MVDKSQCSNNYMKLAFLVALVNLGFFGLMFTLMNYFELMGADLSYFDNGSWNNIKIINFFTKLVGLDIDPSASPKISTLAYSACYGMFLLSSFVAITFALRQGRTENEVTDAS